MILSRIIVGLDFGTTRIRACACKMDYSGDIKLLYTASKPSKAFECGNIRNMEYAISDVRDILLQVEKQIGKRFKRVVLSLRGLDIGCLYSKGMVGISHTPRPVTQSDIRKCINVSSMMEIKPDVYVIDKSISDFFINEENYVASPKGMFATKLGVKIIVLTAKKSKILNLKHCLEQSGFWCEHICPEMLATSKAVTGRLPVMPTAIFDIGSKMTGLAVFSEKKLKYAGYIPAGSDDYSNNSGDAYLSKLKQCLFKIPVKVSDVIMTGGGVLKEDLLEKAESKLGIRVKPGKINSAIADLDSRDSNIYAASLGAVLSYRDLLIQERHAKNLIKKTSDYVESIIATYF